MHYVTEETLESLLLTGKSEINATLKRSAQDLENVVVSVLNWERGDKLGSSVSRVSTIDKL